MESKLAQALRLTNHPVAVYRSDVLPEGAIQFREGVWDEQPELVVFLVNPDRLSALAGLANYDTPNQDNVKLLFGAGCTQSVLYGLDAYEQGQRTCYIGLTDLSARKVIDKDILSFSIPYQRYLEMEANVDECFFKTETWEYIVKRLD